MKGLCEGHVDVRLHPPHTIGNSIQLQAALAIPQLFLTAHAQRCNSLHWGFVGKSGPR